MIFQEISDEQATGFYGFKAILDANQVDYSSLRPELCRVTASFLGECDKSFRKCWLEDESNLLIREFKHKRFLETVEAETGIKRQERRTNAGSEETKDPSLRTKDQSYVKNWQKDAGSEEFALATYYWFHVFCPYLKYADQIDQALLTNQSEKQKHRVEKLIKVKKRICQNRRQTAIFYIPQKTSNTPSEQSVPDEQNKENIAVKNPENIPPIIRYKSPPSDDNNPFHERHVPYIGREAEFALLDAFAEHSDKFKVWAISGPSGAGKTRLACKWLGESEKLSDWDWIILKPNALKHKKPSYWEAWTPKRNTVLIIDYLYGFREVLHTLLDHFRDLQESKALTHTVRILLIDHVFPEKLEELQKDTRLGIPLMTNREMMESYHPIFFDNSPLNLEKTPDQDEIIPQIIRNAAGSDVTEESILSATAFLKRTLGAWHPLFAVLIGDALKKAPKGSQLDFTTWNRRDLITCYLSGDQRLPWMQGESSPIWASAFIAAATALNGANFDKLTACIPDSDNNPIGDYPEIKDICRSIISVSKIRHTVPSFKPDMLGESFFLLFLQALQEGSKTLRPVRKPFIAMLSSASQQTQSGDDTQFIGFITRLTRNLCNDDQNDPEVEAHWQTLLTFLNPENFDATSSIRWEVSAALIHCAILLEEFHPYKRKKESDQMLQQVDIDKLCEVRKNNTLRISLIHAMQYYEIIWKSEEKRQNIAPKLLKLCKQFEEISKSHDCVTALMIASLQGYVAVLQLLLENGAHINAKDNKDITGLMRASLNGHKAVVRLLLENGADINATNFIGMSALMFASFEGHENVVSLLIEKGANVNLQCTEEDTTALMFATQNSHEGVIRLLLKNGADINATNFIGVSSLMIASVKGYATVVRMLIENGANVNSQSYGGFTILMIVSLNGQEAMARLLIENGADVNLQYRELSALFFAHLNNHEAMVRLLVDNGAYH